MKVSNSRISTFKSCRRMYQLKYIYGFEPIAVPDALSTGTSYHECVEHILRGEEYDAGDPKINGMADAFKRYIAKDLNAMEVEKWFEYQTESGHTVFGRVDAITTSGDVIEHKTTSGLIDGAYFQRLDFDEQIPTYMMGCGTDTVYYTVCAKPTIRQKKTELDEWFRQRCFEWYEEDTESKIKVVELKRSAGQLAEFFAEQDDIITEMENCKLFYRNPNNCMKWGRMCEYAPICMNCDPNGEYIQFKRRENEGEKT